MTIDLEQTLKEVFEKVKSKYGYIPLKKVNLDDTEKTACIDMSDFSIKVGKHFVEELSKSMNTSDAIEGLLDHEVCHYLYHPYSLKRLILEHNSVKDLQYGDDLRGFYDDVNDNLRSIIKNDSVTTIPEIYKNLKIESKVEKILSRLYSDLTQLDFGEHDLDTEMNEAVDKLKKINYLNYNIETSEIEWVKESDKQNIRDLKKFYNILKPFYDEDVKNNQKPNQQLGNGPSMNDYSGKDIRKAIKELIESGEISKNDAKDLIKELSDKLDKDSGDFPGGNYNDNPELFADRFYYESLACKYSIRLKKIPLESKSGMYPTELEKFEVGDSALDLDPFNSFGGKIIPGLSNKWIKRNVKYHGEKEKTPDLMIILDDSGSMPDPTQNLSGAVLGSFVVAKEYLKNRSKVSVVRFSDRTVTKDFTNNSSDVLNELLKYKGGSDTVLEIKKIKELDNSQNICDYILITDGEIRNRDKIIEHLNSKVDIGARAYVLEIKENNKITYNYEGRVKVYNLNSSDDFGKIILDDMHKKK